MAGKLNVLRISDGKYRKLYTNLFSKCTCMDVDKLEMMTASLG
jgi:hypothetical protein